LKTFALIGAAGYVAPRHIKAIKDVGGHLVAALDPHDSVGVLDQYFPGCLYFREPERFDRWLSKNPVDYVSVCSPNYLHDCHSLMAMRNGADVICEKPLVCNERNLDNLAEWEVKTGRRINAILQCRLHPDTIRMKDRINKPACVDIEYCTPRGPWYHTSWKGDVEKSGGLPTNIGVHLFDLCHYLFGNWRSFDIEMASPDLHQGSVVYEHADVNWRLSTSITDRFSKQRIFKIDSEMLNLTSGFDHLHSESYHDILNGRGYGIEDARDSIRLVEAIRNVKQD
jgi:UDP-N-acetyl-2-amino-2-deoxyglucuronate dehydrogenase